MKSEDTNRQNGGVKEKATTLQQKDAEMSALDLSGFCWLVAGSASEVYLLKLVDEILLFTSI